MSTYLGVLNISQLQKMTSDKNQHLVSSTSMYNEYMDLIESSPKIWTL